ncbi:RNA-directed DNA polymerase, eukaryota [Tanacetum coccineum]
MGSLLLWEILMKFDLAKKGGSCFNPYSARYFDRFISNAGLVDVTLEGYAFTWAHPSASKMSKLDRFLVSDELAPVIADLISDTQYAFVAGANFRGPFILMKFSFGLLKEKNKKRGSFSSILPKPIRLGSLRIIIRSVEALVFGCAERGVIGLGNLFIYLFNEVVDEGLFKGIQLPGVLKDMESIRSRFFNGADLVGKKLHGFAWNTALVMVMIRDSGSIVGWRRSSSYISFRRNARGAVFEEHLLADLTSLMDSVTLSNSGDRWVCDLVSDGNFRVKEIRNYIDDLFLPHQAAQTRWIKYIPIKVNIFAWRARQDFCEEDVCHIFFRCDLAQLVLRRICRWWGLDPHDWSSFQEWQSWILSDSVFSRSKLMLEGSVLRILVVYLELWNRIIFEDLSRRSGNF